MRQLGVFAKFWAPGEVKSRLAADIGAEQAARLHAVFVRTLLARFAETAERRVLAFSPPERRPEFEALAAEAWLLEPQISGDLGRRMRHYFDSAFAAGAKRVVLIGSDAPTLPADYLETAFERLAAYPVVLGPASDGGYYLVGAADRSPPIFDSISWSQSTVFAETVAALETARLEYSTLPGWYDVDRQDDLKRLHDELRAGKDSSAPLKELTREATRALGAV